MVDKKNDEPWDAPRATIGDAVDRGGTTTTILAGGSSGRSSARSSSSSAKRSSRRRRMSLEGSSDLLRNTIHGAGVGGGSSSSAADLRCGGYETARSMRRRMSLGTKSVENVDFCLSPVPAKPWSCSVLAGGGGRGADKKKDGQQQPAQEQGQEQEPQEQPQEQEPQQERRPGSASPRVKRSSRRRLSLVEPLPTHPSGRAANGLRSTVHGDCSAANSSMLAERGSFYEHHHAQQRQGSNRSLMTGGNPASMKKKTKKFGKALLQKLRSTGVGGDPAVSPAGNSADHDCGEKASSSNHSRSSGNADHEYDYDDEASFFSSGSSKSSRIMAESVRSCDPELLSSPRSKRPGKKKQQVIGRSYRSADDNASVNSGDSNSNNRFKSREKKSSRRKTKRVSSTDSLPEVTKTKRRGRNMYKMQQQQQQSGSVSPPPPPDDVSPRLGGGLGGSSNHSRSSTRSGSIGKKPFRTGSVGKKSSKKLEKLSQHSTTSLSRSSSVGKKPSRSASSSSKKMERKADIKAMKKMDCMLGQLEKYEDNLENEMTALRKQLDDMALEKEYVEQRNHELESQLEELKEKAVTDAGLLVNAESTRDRSDKEVEQLKIEKDILERRLQRHEMSLLRTQQLPSSRTMMEDCGGGTTSEDLPRKDEEIARLKADLGLLRDKLRDKTKDHDKQSAELEQAKDELAMINYNMEHTGSFRYHNMHQLIREKQTMKMQPEEVALSNFFDAY